MQIRHIGPRSHRDLEITSHRPTATLEDLLALLEDPAAGAHAWVDGQRVPKAVPLAGSGLIDGSTVSSLPVPVARSATEGPAGPGPAPPPLARSGPGDRTLGGPGRTVPRNRTGRVPLPPSPCSIDLPDPMPPTPTVTPIGVVAMVASGLGAGVLVAVLGSWMYAAFAVLGPLMMVANALDSRLRGRRAARRYAKLIRRELVRLAADLEGCSAAERARRAVAFTGGAAATSIGSAEPPLCWERRPTDPDAFSVRVGCGAAWWEPPVRGDLANADESVQALFAASRVLDGAPIGTSLEPGAPLTVVGPGDSARSVARSIVAQLAAVHGPADLAIAAVVAPEHALGWDWLAWLPHAVDRDGHRIVTTSGPPADELVGAPMSFGEGPTLVVIDDADGLQARRSAARTLLRAGSDPARDIRCLVVLGPDDAVPASCTAVAQVGPDGTLRGLPELVAGAARADQLDLRSATDLARRLARFDDPEQDGLNRLLPTEVRLRSLLALDDDRIDPALDAIDPATTREPDGRRPAGAARRGASPSHLLGAGVAERWAHAGPDPAPVALLGVTSDGPASIDLAADGPHALVVGTTGAGKSEALRSLVLSLAVSQSPDHLVFVLIDFKGGSAFDACADLPHTVGLVTDLDDHLAARALRCLEAELRHREERFRTCGATDLAELRRKDRTGEPLPRLVVVVDEFATLAAAVPEFVDALVDVAQRGRSLGVHLVLATQRPGGAITPAMRANIGLRLALRVQSADDSRDVIGSDAAARLPRRVPGRAVLGFGSDEMVTLQLACASLPSTRSVPPLTVRPLGLTRADPTGRQARGSREAPSENRCEQGADDAAPGAAGSPPGRSAAPGPGSGSGTDLTELTGEIASAWATSGRPAPRRPWPDPLPVTVGWPVATSPGRSTSASQPSSARDGGPADRWERCEEGGSRGGAEGQRADRACGGRGSTGLTIGLADQPDLQRLAPFTWDHDAGPLLGIGLPGTGTAALASTVALAAAARWSPLDCHIYAIDGTGSELAVLSGLPHVGAVVTSGEGERQRRLLHSLAAELADRRAGPFDRRRCVFVVHGVTALQARWEESGHHECWSMLVDLVADGARHAIHVCATAEGASVPQRLLSACSQRMVFRLGDPADRAVLGFPTRPAVDLPFARALAATGQGDPLLVQVAQPAEGLPAAVARLSGTADPAATSGAVLPRWIGVLPDVVRPADLDPTDGLRPVDLRPAEHPPPADHLEAVAPPPTGVHVDDRRSPGPHRQPGGGLRLPIGLADRGLTTASLDLPPGAHAVVSGPPGSGRTTALEAIAGAAARLPGVGIVVVAPIGGGSWPDPAAVVEADGEALDDLLERPGPLLVLVDDADRTPDDHRVLTRLTLDRRPDRHVVAAGRSDRFRSGYGHWSKEVRVEGIGLLLTPDPDLDGDLLGIRLPRRPAVAMVPGRAWMTGRGEGADGFVQVVCTAPVLGRPRTADRHPSLQAKRSRPYVDILKSM